VPPGLLIRLAAPAAAIAVVLAGCGGSDQAPPERPAPPPDRTAPAPPPAPRPAPGPVRLDDRGGTVSWTAGLPRAVRGRSAPSVSAPAWAWIEPRTPYSRRRAGLMVTGAYRDAQGRGWVRVQLAMRPNGTAVWVPRRSVRLSATPLRVKVSLAARRLEVWRGGERVGTWSAAIGRPGTPTPVGRFAIEDLVPSPPDRLGAYGRYVLTLTAYSPTLTDFDGGQGQSAIHGAADADARLGREASFGCVVVGDEVLESLYRTLRPGTPVEITA
jgi:lipoprotein-anchoring transpeptidase ErfK/SrfK